MTTTMNHIATAPDQEFVAYEYATAQVDRDLEPVYRDAYASFGWVVEGTGPSSLNTRTVTLNLKRDRRLKGQPAMVELQNSCEAALAEIVRLERSKSAASLTSSLSVGLVGTAAMAGSVFALNADATWLSIVLGAVGLIGWVLGFLTHGYVARRKAAQIAPLIDHAYSVVYDTCEQASRLLS